MQQDLFDSRFVSSSSSVRSRKTDFLGLFRVSLRLDQALMGLIVMLFFFVVIFSFGVEKGKGYAKEEIAAERAKRENVLQAFRVKRFIGLDPILEASEIRSTPQKMQEVVHRRADALQTKVLETAEAPETDFRELHHSDDYLCDRKCGEPAASCAFKKGVSGLCDPQWEVPANLRELI